MQLVLNAAKDLTGKSQCCAPCMHDCAACAASTVALPMLPRPISSCALQAPWLVVFGVLTVAPQTVVCYYLMLATRVSQAAV